MNLDIPESWAVVCQDNQLGFSLTDHLLRLFVAQDIFSTLHHQLETRVDGLHGLFLNRETQRKRQHTGFIASFCRGYTQKCQL